MRLAFLHSQRISYYSRLRRTYQPVLGQAKFCDRRPVSFVPRLQRCAAAKAVLPFTGTQQDSLGSSLNKDPLQWRLGSYTETQQVRKQSNGTATAASTNKKAVIGIDPDNQGAVAIISLPVENDGLLEHLSQTDVEVYDMPLEEINVGKRIRRQTNSIAAAKIVRKIIADNKGSAELQAVLEEPVPNPVNGLLSVLGTGFAFGVWKGVLASHEVELETVSARRWKADLGLNKAGKEGSRLLALQLFPKAAGLLKRKKDHGRAEALLIMAWALGLRALKPRPEEPGDTIITDDLSHVPSSTVIADSTLGNVLNNKEGIEWDAHAEISWEDRLEGLAPKGHKE